MNSSHSGTPIEPPAVLAVCVEVVVGLLVVVVLVFVALLPVAVLPVLSLEVEQP